MPVRTDFVNHAPQHHRVISVHRNRENLLTCSYFTHFTLQSSTQENTSARRMTRIVLLILSILQVLVITESLLTRLPHVSRSLSPPQTDNIKVSKLSVIPSSSSAQSVGWGGPQFGWGSQTSSGGSGTKTPCKTAIESAVNVEWEPLTELERRINDGIHYEHIPNLQNRFQGSKQGRIPDNRSYGTTIAGDHDDGDLAQVQSIFCGYRFTEDEYNRLQSAKVVD
jgi:hypothetical protein